VIHVAIHVARTIIKLNYQSGQCFVTSNNEQASMSFQSVVISLLHKIDVTFRYYCEGNLFEEKEEEVRSTPRNFD
jgi:hypothetical protein